MILLACVEIYSSYAYAVEPRAFELDGVYHRVRMVEREWKTPDCRHYLVADENQARYELIYHEAGDRWFLRKLGETGPMKLEPEVSP